MYDFTTGLFQAAAGSQDEEVEEDEEESGDEADLAKYDLWGSEDESSKTGGSSKTAGSSKGKMYSKSKYFISLTVI